jgi:hypothetical protein
MNLKGGDIMNTILSSARCWPVLVCAGLLLSCGDIHLTSSAGTERNIPAIGKAANSFGFSVLAESFSFQEEFPVTFNASPLNIGISVTGFKAGSGRLDLMGPDGTLIFTKAIGQNLAFGETVPLATPPQKAIVSFTGFTGIVAIGVAGKP